MSFTKKCKSCPLTITYTNEEELKPYFYKKGDYWLSDCKKCQLKKHADKYKDGKYNYHKKHDTFEPHRYSFGRMEGCG
jgi:hypothetical protein